MNEFELRRQLRALPRERTPVRDLYPAIEARLTRPPAARRSVWQRPWVLAASLALFAVLLAPLLRAPMAPGPDSASSVSALSPAGDDLSGPAAALVAEYQAALAQLAAPLPGRLQPVAEQLDVELRELQLALEQQPDSPLLLRQLRRAFDQRLRLGQRSVLG